MEYVSTIMSYSNHKVRDKNSLKFSSRTKAFCDIVLKNGDYLSPIPYDV